MKDFSELTVKIQIIKGSGTNAQWLNKVNKHIDMPENLIYYLECVGAEFIINEAGIWASVRDCLIADGYALKDHKN